MHFFINDIATNKVAYNGFVTIHVNWSFYILKFDTFDIFYKDIFYRNIH